MLSEKTIKKWVRDNNKYIGFNQYYWANGETFKTAFIYHYYNKNLDREIKKADFSTFMRIVKESGGKMRNGKTIFNKYTIEKMKQEEKAKQLSLFDTPAPKKTAKAKKSAKKQPEKPKLEKIIVTLPNGKKYEVETLLRKEKPRKTNNNAIEKMEKLLTGSRFIAKQVKK